MSASDTDPPDELAARVLAMAERRGVDAEARVADRGDEYPGEPVPQVAAGAVPINVAASGFVDLVFERGVLMKIMDATGRETEVGNWLDVGTSKILRLPWAPGGLVDMDPESGKPSFVQRTSLMRLPTTSTQAAKVLGLFMKDWREGGYGLIDEDIVSRLSMKIGSVTGRRHRLVEEGWLRPTGRTGRTAKDKESKQWELSPAAITQLNLTRGT